MIICSCNVISDREVHAAAKPCGAPADRTRDVFRSLGRTPKCGKCIRGICAALESRASATGQGCAHEGIEDQVYA